MINHSNCDKFPLHKSAEREIQFTRVGLLWRLKMQFWRTQTPTPLFSTTRTCASLHWETAWLCGELISFLPQMDSWRVCVIAPNASRPHRATARGASPLSKSAALGWCLSAAAWRGRRKPVCFAPQRHPSTRPFSAAPTTCATATLPPVRWCHCFQQVDIASQQCQIEELCSIPVYWIIWHFIFPVPLSILLLLPAPEGEPVRYRVETLALFVLGPVVVLALLSVVSVLACRRLHHGRLQRLQEFDTEQGAIDGLITSNVGDSTLAVRLREVLIMHIIKLCILNGV